MSGRLRLVLVAPFAREPKGTTRGRVLPLARALAARGHQVTVLIPPYDNPRESGARYCVGEARVEALAVPAGVREQSLRQALLQPRLALAVARRALALRPDAVHVFKPKAVSGLAQLVLWYRRRLGGGPALVLDTDDWEGHGGWNEYESYPWWQKEVCDLQERWGLAHADAVTVASRTLQVQAWSRRVAPSRVIYLPNGLDPESYPHWQDALPAGPPAAGSDGGPWLLLYTRFFEFQPERPVDVLAQVRRVVPNARLLVVGAGKYGQERRLQAHAARCGLASAVCLAGWQPPAALPGLLALADVALCPADDTLANRAKCSVKLLELLWLGKAVVADRVGEQAEYVRHGENGLLSDPDDPGSMARAAALLLTDPALAARLGAAGRRSVEQEFNWARLSERAERAYTVALQRHEPHEVQSSRFKVQS